MSVEAVNAFNREVYLPVHNAGFAVAAAQPGSAFTPIPGVDLDEILCVEEERQVMNDNCVSYRTLKLQIPLASARTSLKARVVVFTSAPDGSHTVFFMRGGASAATTRTERSGMWVSCLNPLASEPVDMWTTLDASPTCPQENRSRRSGHEVCYQNRTS